MANREIKFRGKRTDTKNWVHGYYFKTPLTDENSGTDSSAGWFFLTGKTRHCISHEHGVAFTIIPETVGQFTGLKDKNVKEIYEGDIVSCISKLSKYQGNYGTITWDDEECQYHIKWIVNKSEWNNYIHVRIDELEIIGNIYEHPELLKK